jgi:hypothetical protein
MRFDSDRVIGISAMVVSAASLFVVVYQAQLQRDQMELERRATAASVMPYLMMNMTLTNDGTAFNLRNAGLGPARIDGVRVLHKGSEVRGDAADFYLKMRKDQAQPYSNDSIKVGRLVPAGEWVQMLGSAPGAAFTTPMALEIVRLFRIEEAGEPRYQAAAGMGVVFEDAVLEVTYSSVFGEQWILRSDDLVPQPVAPARP